jgi:hypothetical protein
MRHSPKQATPKEGCDKESELHAQIFDECRRRGWIALHGSMADRTCRTEGEPDFSIMADGGRRFDIECKTRTGKLSPAQTAMIHHAKRLGHTVHVVRSFEEFLKLICLPEQARIECASVEKEEV